MNPQKAMGLSKHLCNAIDAIDRATEELQWYECNLNFMDPMESYVRGRIHGRIEDLERIAKELDNQLPDERGDAE